jgi:putative Mg2+ transporter-C (MgtC) family protein
MRKSQLYEYLHLERKQVSVFNKCREIKNINFTFDSIIIHMNWEQLISTINSSQITLGAAFFKMLLSLIAGGLVGLNRERHNQPAGFRTHILICMGACLLMILSIYIPQTYFGFKNGDPGRIAAQVVSGIGFLGAGAIIRLGTNVRGITTAASIWLISAVGMAIGAGLYTVAFFVVILALFTLIVLERLEHRFFPSILLKTLTLTLSNSNYEGDKIKAILKKSKITISDYSVDIQNNNGKPNEIILIVKIPETLDLTHLIHQLNALPNLSAIKIM